MKLQHLTVIFAIIFLPLVIITSYYIQRQVDTVDLQLSYDSKLLDATYDALTAFEINTANEDLSTVSDSLRSILEASNNIFFNTLATNMGISNASKSYIQPYIPAILYTLYDGYYIYSPASTPIVCTDSYGNTIDTSSYGVKFKGTTTVNGQTIGLYEFDESKVDYTDSVATGVNDNNYIVDYSNLKSNNIEEEYGSLLYQNKDGTTYSTVLHEGCSNVNYDTKYTKSYLLKSYVSYTANYTGKNDDNESIDVTINYTLDNYMSVTGTIGDIYYTKSGYLIDNSLIDSVTIDGVAIKWYTYSVEEIEEFIDNGNTIIVTLNNYDDEGNNTNITISTSERFVNPTTNEYVSDTNQDCKDAVEYYVKAWMFSGWVYENLENLTESNISSNDYNINDTSTSIDDETNLASSLMYDFSGSSEVIFNSSENPEDEGSTFVEHKKNVIKNSIMYNLALAMVTYSQMSNMIEYDLPIISDEEWDSILANVSMVTFMQGLQCGLKYYNNYAIATSTNNELTVTESEIYYVPVEIVSSDVYINEDYVDVYTDVTDNYYNDSVETAHRIDCSDLDSTYTDSSGNTYNVEYYLSFTSKDIKYDKIYDSSLDRYTYDHKAYLDYTCIVNGNYWVYDSSSGTIKYRGNSDLLSNLYTIGNTYKLKAYRIAVAKEKNNLYKSLEYDSNNGYEIFIDSNVNKSVSNGSSITITGGSEKTISQIYKIEITFENARN